MHSRHQTSRSHVDVRGSFLCWTGVFHALKESSQTMSYNCLIDLVGTLSTRHQDHIKMIMNIWLQKDKWQWPDPDCPYQCASAEPPTYGRQNDTLPRPQCQVRHRSWWACSRRFWSRVAKEMTPLRSTHQNRGSCSQHLLAAPFIRFRCACVYWCGMTSYDFKCFRLDMWPVLEWRKVLEINQNARTNHYVKPPYPGRRF